MTARKRPVAARWLGPLSPVLLAALLLRATASLAASPGVALVIGEGRYAGQAVLPACSQAAQAVSARLQRLGFTVDAAIDVPVATLRDTISNFADHVAEAPSGAALAYVCAEATAVDQRLFLLPSDLDLRQPIRPETQGVVVRALLNAMAETKGMLIIELGKPASVDTTPAAKALGDALPAGLHLVLTIEDSKQAGEDGKQAGVLGARLASDETDLGQGWDHLAATLQGLPASPAPASEPAPAPLPSVPPARPVEAAAPPPPAPLPVKPPAPLAETAAPPAPAPAKDEPAPTPVQPPSSPPPPPPAAPPTPPENAKPPRPEPPPPPRERAPERKAARPRPTEPAVIGDERIRRLQIALAHRGFYGGRLDGVANAATAQAIRAYQASLGDPANGALSQTEIVRLLNNW